MSPEAQQAADDGLGVSEARVCAGTFTRAAVSPHAQQRVEETLDPRRVAPQFAEEATSSRSRRPAGYCRSSAKMIVAESIVCPSNSTVRSVPMILRVSPTSQDSPDIGLSSPCVNVSVSRSP